MRFAPLVPLLAIALLSLGCVQSQASGGAVSGATVSPQANVSGTEDVSFITRDGVSIRGTLYKAPTASAPVVVLLHMMGRDRSDWVVLASRLQSLGMNALAIDFRGHGESNTRNGQPYDWHSFSDSDFRNMIYDVEASKDYVRSRGLAGPLGMAGASVGANMALKYAAQDTDVRAVVALSPGVDFKGGPFMELLPDLRGRAVYLAAGEMDYTSIDTVKQIRADLGDSAKWEMFDGNAHGTALLERYPDFVGRIADWLADKLR